MFAAVDELMQARLTTRPFMPCDAELERALFAAAEPAAIRGVVAVAPRPGLGSRATAPLETGTSDAHGDDAGGLGASEAPARGSFATLLDLAQWPAFLADGRRAVDGAPTSGSPDASLGVRSRARAMLRRRRPALVVGSLVGGGALVLLLTLVPPETNDAVSAGTGHDAAAQAAEVPAVDPSAPAAAPEDATAGDDVVAAVQAMLERRAECFDQLDLACLQTIVQPGSAAEADEVAAMGVARDGGDAPAAFDPAGIAVTAEMGSAVLVAVPYATGEREPASLLVMRGEAGWRLREIFG